MKRIGTTLLCLVLLLSILPASLSASAEGERQEYDRYYYTVADGEATIVDFYDVNLREKDIVIPEYFDEYKVVAIGQEAFTSCETIESVVLPETIKSIGYKAFNNCKKMESITLPKNLVKIESSAFSACASLRSISIPEGVKEITADMFDECGALQEIIVDNGVYYSVDGVVYNKAKTEIVRYPEGKKDTSYTVPNKVTVLGEGAFARAYNLKKIELSSNLTTISKGAFYGCKNISTFTIPKKVRSIGNSAFMFCYSLKKIEIPDNVTSFGDGVFQHCTKMTETKLGSGVKTIGPFMFFECSALKKVTIDKAVTEVHEYAFYNCKELSDVYYSGTEKQKAKMKINETNEYFINADWHFEQPTTTSTTKKPTTTKITEKTTKPTTTESTTQPTTIPVESTAVPTESTTVPVTQPTTALATDVKASSKEEASPTWPYVAGGIGGVLVIAGAIFFVLKKKK